MRLPLALLAALAGAGAFVALLRAGESRLEQPVVQRPALELAFARVASGLTRPLYLTHAGDGSERLFIVEQPGRVWVVRDGRLLERPFLDISDLVTSGANEQGLLSIAFHPHFAENGLLYVDYTDRNGDTVVARYRVAPDDPDVADPASAHVLLFVDQPGANHNGGLLLFGPDGYLYIGMGDGGGGAGSQNGQRLDTRLGKLLRIDVDHVGDEVPFAIPPDNPFVGVPGARPEIWLTGLRNPWRFSFDPATGELFIGDVGAATWEEVNVIPAGVGGMNLGWNVYEGWRCTLRDVSCDELGLAEALGVTWPAAGYRHGDRDCAITGGHVYHGAAIPALRGVYLFADYCSGRIWGMVRDAAGRALVSVPLDTEYRISSFGVDEAGELYIVDLRGSVYRLVSR